MTERDLIKALKAHRNDPRLGAMTAEQAERCRIKILEKIGATDFSRPKYSLKDYAEFYVYRFRQSVIRPAMVGVSMMVLVVGGWMTSVSAAYEAVPGDLLYPIKIATEQAQLTIATSDQKRAALHMEFASRRLAEVTAINNSDSVDKTANMKTAVAAFKAEVAEVKTVMQNMDGGEDAANVASAFESKTSEYVAVIEQTVSALDATSDVTVEVAAAKADVEQAGNDAVEVMVTSVEASPEVITIAEDLQKSFQKRLLTIDERVKLALGRIAVLQHVVDTDPEVKLSLTEWVSVEDLGKSLRGFDDQIHDAMNVLAAGGFRSANEILTNVEATIDRVDAEIVTLELSVVEQRAAKQVEVEPVEVEEEVLLPESVTNEAENETF